MTSSLKRYASFTVPDKLPSVFDWSKPLPLKAGLNPVKHPYPIRKA